MPPASFLKIDLEKFKWNKIKNFEDINSTSGLNFKKWWKIDLKYNDNKNKYDFFEQKKYIHSLLRESVKQQLISDVPLGAFLSGGIDSSLIVSLMTEFSSQ